MKFISYYTPGDYENVMNTHLRPSLEWWNLNHYIEETEDLKNWNLNTAYKPTFILNALNKYKEDIVFLDADATIESYPQLLFDLPKETDLGAHWFDWFLHWRNQTGGNNFHLLSGTLFIKYNEKMLNLVKEWISKCQEQSNVWEQKILQQIVEKRNDLNIYKLPANYCAVIDRKGKVPNYIKEPVIIHWQKSREFKNRRP